MDQRALIPKHSGSVSKQIRKDRRKKRAELKDEIRDQERAIVAWALTNVPVTDADLEGDEK